MSQRALSLSEWACQEVAEGRLELSEYEGYSGVWAIAPNKGDFFLALSEVTSGKLYVVRHGKTKLNKSSTNGVDRIRGWLDVPLTTEGKREACDVADKLEGLEIDHIYYSNLKRAKTTADIIAEEFPEAKIDGSQAFRPW